MNDEEFDYELSMVLPGQSKVIEQVGFGIGQFMDDDGRITGEAVGLTLRTWNMADWPEGAETPDPIPDEYLTDVTYLLQPRAVRELLILLYEHRAELLRLGITFFDYEANGGE